MKRNLAKIILLTVALGAISPFATEARPFRLPPIPVPPVPVPDPIPDFPDPLPPIEFPEPIFIPPTD